jgi:hypothetical protein
MTTRDAVTIQTLTTNDGTIGTPGTITPANGQKIAAAGLTRNLVIQVKNSGTVTGTVTIAAGAYPPAFREFGGSIVLTVPGSSERIITVESARVVQSDGSVYLDFNATFAGTTYAYRLGADL